MGAWMSFWRTPLLHAARLRPPAPPNPILSEISDPARPQDSAAPWNHDPVYTDESQGAVPSALSDPYPRAPAKPAA
jgi:hypothetical protein